MANIIVSNVKFSDLLKILNDSLNLFQENGRQGIIVMLEDQRQLKRNRIPMSKALIIVSILTF